MDIKITLDASSFEKFLKESPRAFRIALETTIQKGAYLIERIAKQNAPVDTGRLRSSIATEIIPLKATVMPHVNYAKFLEFGTRYMVPHPFMGPASVSADRQIKDILNAEVEKVLA